MPAAVRCRCGLEKGIEGGAAQHDFTGGRGKRDRAPGERERAWSQSSGGGLDVERRWRPRRGAASGGGGPSDLA
ncbi:hypothetical protein E2562_028089 [Oryza meyeriana var. granulata]|uniref:Uncharacterized protein n=1 Tax=Oryza meyeriana var. granulata TaxID=110450 RepID=A0A6G1C9L8_9ORYZ|nr:hypothetical protein E2562_028089 [Oryza meyeriana var. granulata]